MSPDQRKIEAQRKVASMTEALGKLVGDQDAELRGRIARKAVDEPAKSTSDAEATGSSKSRTTS